MSARCASFTFLETPQASAGAGRPARWTAALRVGRTGNYAFRVGPGAATLEIGILAHDLPRWHNNVTHSLFAGADLRFVNVEGPLSEQRLSGSQGRGQEGATAKLPRPSLVPDSEETHAEKVRSGTALRCQLHGPAQQPHGLDRVGLGVPGVHPGKVGERVPAGCL